MDALILLRQAVAEGLEVQVEGDRLVVRGPVRLAPLARSLLEHKAELLPLLTWDEGLADRLLREALQQVAAQFRPAWAGRFRADARWLLPQARIEAAVLTRDMPAFVLAVEEYEEFALRRFTEYAADGDGNAGHSGGRGAQPV